MRVTCGISRTSFPVISVVALAISVVAPAIPVVAPAKAGVQVLLKLSKRWRCLDPRLRGDDVHIALGDDVNMVHGDDVNMVRGNDGKVKRLWS
jgi:hypothetical protein